MGSRMFRRRDDRADANCLSPHQTFMFRTLLIAVFVSCLFGTLLGLGIARSFLAINGWQLEAETQSYEKLVQIAHELVTNPNAQASIEYTTYNFGVKDVKSSGAHDFLITNVGTEDLILFVDKTTCSCTGIDITPSHVPPGKTAKCHLRYNAERAMPGKFSQGGTVRTNDPDNREILLLVEGIFTNPVVVQPPAVHVPRVPSGTTQTATVRFYGYENEPLQLSAPTWTDREHIDFQWSSSKIPETEGTDTTLAVAKWVVEGTITIKPGLPVGSFQDRFQVLTNYPSLPSVTFPVSGQITGNVSVSGQWYNRETGVAHLGQTIRGKSISREISVQISGPSAQSTSVEIKTVEPDWIGTTLSPPRDAGPRRMFTLTVEIPENAPTGSYVFGSDGTQAQITLETNDDSVPVLRIPLQFVVGNQ